MPEREVTSGAPQRAAAGRRRGGRARQLIAGLTVLAAPRWLGGNNLYSMNSFDLLAWTIAAWITVERAWRSTGESDPTYWAVLAPNYGDAGALDLLGRGRGLPRAISGHNNYWLWAPGSRPRRT